MHDILSAADSVAIDKTALYTLLGLSFTLVVSLMAYIVRTLSRVSGQIDQMEARYSERTEDHDRRIRDLEVGRV